MQVQSLTLCIQLLTCVYHLLHLDPNRQLSSLYQTYMLDSFECGVDRLTVNSTVTMNLGNADPLNGKIATIVRVTPATLADKTVRASAIRENPGARPIFFRCCCCCYYCC
jgi:hypothetical protein